eukprot:1401833-Rhodomonas_salina.1
MRLSGGLRHGLAAPSTRRAPGVHRGPLLLLRRVEDRVRLLPSHAHSRRSPRSLTLAQSGPFHSTAVCNGRRYLERFASSCARHAHAPLVALPAHRGADSGCWDLATSARERCRERVEEERVEEERVEEER